MRTSLLLLALGSSLVAPAALASAPKIPADEDIGTRPAQSAPSAGTQIVETDGDGLDTDHHHNRERGPTLGQERHPAPPPQIATDPPGDWYLLHAGVRPHLGTFGGVAALALAHERIERFYGALSLSLIRNDAGSHYGGLQLALGRNLSDDFGGIAQIGIGENRARNFIGLGQVAVAYNRTVDTAALFQLAGYNRAKEFYGALQLGGYNRTDRAFGGLMQLGAFNHSREDFTGFAQIGVFNAQGEDLFDESNDDGRFAGIAQGEELHSNPAISLKSRQHLVADTERVVGCHHQRHRFGLAWRGGKISDGLASSREKQQ